MEKEPTTTRNSEELLELIFGYIENISKERALDNVLLLLADLGRELIGADRCTVWLWDKKAHELYTRVAHGVDELRLPEGAGLVGYAVSIGEDVIINDPYNDPHFNRDTDRQTGYVTREVIVIPIRSDNGDILGAYQAVNKMTDEGIFTDRDLKYLRLAASYSGKSIETALLNEEIDKAQREIINILGYAGEHRSLETGNHVTRVAAFATLLGRQMGLSPKSLETLTLAAPMHDIGKIGIPDAVLQKPGSFTNEEYDIMKRHSEIGSEILKRGDSSLLQVAAEIAAGHHERYDGKGYPLGKTDGEIDPYARIVAVADVFDALISDRCYKKAWEPERVHDLFIEERGRQFDPEVVDALLEVWDEMLDTNARSAEGIGEQ
ncbi:MAG: HD domain-containing protein [Oscillospiraceae bacterium]|nr:HD domain-containing protein [Oscillospiraceae bacterium]